MSFGDAVGGSSSGTRGTFGGVSSYQRPTQDDEHERLLSVVTNNVKQIQFNVGRLNKMVQLIGTDKDTEEHRNKLYVDKCVLWPLFHK